MSSSAMFLKGGINLFSESFNIVGYIVGQSWSIWIEQDNGAKTCKFTFFLKKIKKWYDYDQNRDSHKENSFISSHSSEIRGSCLMQ